MSTPSKVIAALPAEFTKLQFPFVRIYTSSLPNYILVQLVFESVFTLQANEVYTIGLGGEQAYLKEYSVYAEPIDGI